MNRADLDILAEPAVYPGHPVTLAYLIVRLYPSLDAARARGNHYAAVEEDSRLPGAGGHNREAVALLSRLVAGEDWEAEMAHAADLWRCVDGQANGDGRLRKRHHAGQVQADRVAPLLREAVATWGKTASAPDGGTPR